MRKTHHGESAAMTLVQLETFLAVARTESFTKAAPLVHLSQSAISRQIQDLEKSLGVQLFERFGGRVSLTTAGRTLMADAPKVLRQAENVRQRLREIAQGTSGDIRLGVTISAANTFMPQVLAQFRRANRSVELSLLLAHTPVLLEKLRMNEIDIAVVGTEMEQADLEVCYRILDELVLVAAPDHPLANKKPLRPKQLNGVEFISRESGSDTRALVEKWLGEWGVEVKVQMALW
jgi:DNA-binding transcriptional LysR family regulator